MGSGIARSSLAVATQITWLASIGTSANSSGEAVRGVVLEQAVERAERVVGVLAAGLVDLVDHHHHRVGVLAVDQRLEHGLPGRAPFHWLEAPSTQPAVSGLIEMKPHAGAQKLGDAPREVRLADAEAGRAAAAA